MSVELTVEEMQLRADLLVAKTRIEELETHLKIARGGWKSNDDEDYRPRNQIKAEGIRDAVSELKPHKLIAERFLEYADKLASDNEALEKSE